MYKKIPVLVLSLFLFSSCFALPVEEPVPLPPVLASGAEAAYRTTETTRGDVVLYQEIAANYVAAKEESLAFDIGDEYISTVNVDIGDAVEAGDVMAEIDRQTFIDELEALELEEAWVRLDLSHLEESYELQLAEAEAEGDSPNAVLADGSAYEASSSELLSKLEAIQVRREYLQLESERRILRAGLSGMVTYALPFSEGEVSVADKVVVTIADQSESVFMVRGEETAPMEIGNHYEITIDQTAYDAVVIDPGELGITRESNEEKYLVITDAEQPVVTSRTYARVMLVLDESTDVLKIPAVAVKKANARVFVYVLEDGVRGIKDIEIGLEGNSETEIVSGLEEGEAVILD